MLKAIYAVFASAVVAGSFIAALDISAEVEARGSAPGAKGDRADARPLAGMCSAHAWPYFEATCLRDTRNPFGQAQGARLVSLDDLASARGGTMHPIASAKPAPPKPREALRSAADRRVDARARLRPLH